MEPSGGPSGPLRRCRPGVAIVKPGRPEKNPKRDPRSICASPPLRIGCGSGNRWCGYAAECDRDPGRPHIGPGADYRTGPEIGIPWAREPVSRRFKRRPCIGSQNDTGARRGPGRGLKIDFCAPGLTLLSGIWGPDVKKPPRERSRRGRNPILRASRGPGTCPGQPAPQGPGHHVPDGLRPGERPGRSGGPQCIARPGAPQ